jgi:hypothetical protein
MSGLFSRLSSDLSGFFAPKVEVSRLENRADWYEGVVNFHKEQADWYLDWVPYYKRRVSWHKTWVCGVYPGSIKLCKEYVPLYEGKADFHKDREGVHWDEARKRESGSYLDKKQAVSHAEQACFHQNEAEKYKRTAEWLKDSIGVLEDFVRYGTDQICWNEAKTCLCKDFSSWYQDAIRGKIDLDGKDALNIRKNELDDRKYKLDARVDELNVRWENLNVRKQELDVRRNELNARKKEIDVHQNEFNMLLDKFNSHGNEINIHRAELSAYGKEIHDRLISLKDCRLQLLQHPAVVQRQELILVLQGICKVLLKRKNENILFFENKSATIASWKLMRTMELVLKWLKSSIFKELRSLGARLLMKM